MSREMSAQLLTTKFRIPPQRPNLVSRPRLIERLNEGLQLGNKLTLISAPAGFGKTTLANAWVQTMRETKPSIAVAWLSLDDRDGDLARFLAYLVAAVNQVEAVEAALGQDASGLLQSSQPPPTEAFLTFLINQLVSLPDRIILVLDDYHDVDSSQVDDALTFLIEYMPPQMHLVIVTRVDPHLPLSRLRARGELTELRAADLRFTSSEAAEFLNQVMGLSLAADDIAALETRTEGWITGLQLAAISLHGKTDASTFIASFAGSHRLVLDYLIDEVLSQQPETVQAFLLQTAILHRLSAGLCNAITGQEDGQRILEELERANLFIVPLDNERHWYRYHHLFAELLRQRLKASEDHQFKRLHLQASTWYERNNFPEEAIEHALQGQALERAANLVASEAEAAWERNEEITLGRWLNKLPEALVVSIPQLWMFHAWRLFLTGQRQAAEQMFDDIERTLSQDAPSDRVLAIPDSIQLQEDERIKLQGRVETARAFISFFDGDEQAIITRTQKALALLPPQDLSWRSMVVNSLADAYYFLGDMPTAYQTRLEALELSKAAGNHDQIMLANLKLAVTLRAKGELEEVLEICRQQDQIANDLGMSETVVAGYLRAIWGEALAEMDDLASALPKALKGVELTENRADVATLGFSYVWLIRVLFSSGDLDGAEQVARKMERTVRELDMLPWITDALAGWRARIWLEQNRMDEAVFWAKGHKLVSDGEISSVNEAAYRAFARLLLAQGQFDSALALLRRLWERAKTGGRTSTMLEILNLEALALQAQDETDIAVAKLERALTLAQPAGFIRAFVDEGAPMGRLLQQARSRGIAPEYVRRLLAAFPDDEYGESIGLPRSPAPDSDLIEPLSDRELEVLQLIAEGLTNREIAARLFLSLHTVKAHTRNIYGKLDVHSRTQAVARAKALGMLLLD